MGNHGEDRSQAEEVEEERGHGSSSVEELERRSTTGELQEEPLEDDPCRASMRALVEEARRWSLSDALARSPHVTRENVETLRQWCRERDVHPTDIELVAFIHSCNGDLDKVHKAVIMYHGIRTSTPEVFKDRSFHCEGIQQAKALGYTCVLPKKTPEGYRIVLQAVRNPDTTNFVYADAIKSQYLLLDACIRADPTAAGYIFLNDTRGISMTHLWKGGFWLPRKLTQYFQEANPLRLISGHCLYASPLVDKMMKMVKPLLRKEVLAMLHFHTANDMDSLFKFVPRDCVPEDFGGTLPSVEKLQAASDYFMESMEDLAPY